MAKVEFTQILEQLDRVEADAAAAVIETEREIVDTKFQAPALEDGAYEQLNQLELAGQAQQSKLVKWHSWLLESILCSRRRSKPCRNEIGTCLGENNFLNNF